MAQLRVRGWGKWQQIPWLDLDCGEEVTHWLTSVLCDVSGSTRKILNVEWALALA